MMLRSLLCQLQEAFQAYKQDAISKLRARQKRLALSSKERHLQEMLEKERNRLFAEEKRKKEANPEAHPLSGKRQIQWRLSYGYNGLHVNQVMVYFYFLSSIRRSFVFYCIISIGINLKLLYCYMLIQYFNINISSIHSYIQEEFDVNLTKVQECFDEILKPF